MYANASPKFGARCINKRPVPDERSIPVTSLAQDVSTVHNVISEDVKAIQATYCKKTPVPDEKSMQVPSLGLDVSTSLM